MATPSNSAEYFQAQIGCLPPDGLLELLNSEAIRQAVPVRFHFEQHDWTIEIQHFVNVFDLIHYRPAEKLLTFAINTDGHSYVVDLSNREGMILQDEFGDIESLGITIRDLLNARCVPIVGNA